MTIAWSDSLIQSRKSSSALSGEITAKKGESGLFSFGYAACSGLGRPHKNQETRIPTSLIFKSSAVAPEHQGRAHQAGAAVEVQLNPIQGGNACNYHLYLNACAGQGFSEPARAFKSFLSDTPDGLPGGQGDNPIRPCRMSHTPAVPPHPLSMSADDYRSGIIQALPAQPATARGAEREYHKRFYKSERALGRDAGRCVPRRRGTA